MLRVVGLYFKNDQKKKPASGTSLEQKTFQVHFLNLSFKTVQVALCCTFPSNLGHK